MTKVQDQKKALSAALNIALGTKGVTFEQMSLKNMNLVWDALKRINDKGDVDA